MPINLIDKKPIESYLERFLPDDPQATSLLKMALVTPLSKREENMELVTILPDDAPAWARQKLAEGKQIHRFEPDHGLDAKVHHIADWIKAAVVNQAEWVSNIDGQGKPIRFKKIDSIERATEEADKDMRLANRELAEQLKLLPVGEGETTVKELENGYRIVQLTTTNALKREGTDMGHCLGQGAYDKKLTSGSHQFFSLRDAKNEPHATIEVDIQKHAVQQCMGKKNKPAVVKYLPYIVEFLKDRRYRLDVSEIDSGLIQVEDAYYSIFNLPENLHVPGNLDLSYTRITSLPKGLNVGGNLILLNTPIALLPDGLKVGGNLYIYNTRITSLPRDIKVGGDMDLSGSNITSLYEGLEISHSLHLVHSLVTSLPKGLKVPGNLDLTACTFLMELPEELTVLGDLNVQSSGIRSIPKSAKINGRILADPGQLITVDETLPEATQKPQNKHDSSNEGAHVDALRKKTSTKSPDLGRGGTRTPPKSREDGHTREE